MRTPVRTTRRRADHYHHRPRANPWMAIGWIVVGGILAVILLFMVSFCGLAAVLAGA